MMNLFFITLWVLELLFLLYMWIDEMKLQFLTMPTYIPVGFLWLLIAAILKWVMKYDKAALIMVSIPGVPLVFMGLFLVIVFLVNWLFGPIRWQ